MLIFAGGGGSPDSPRLVPLWLSCSSSASPISWRMATSGSSDGDASMYLTFYGLNEKPFTTAPDPRFLYLNAGYREALAHLVYGVQENTGFLVLTGEVGTGKTSLLRIFLNKVDAKTAVAFIANSGMSFDNILEYALEQFGIPTAGASRARRFVALQRFLTECT